MSNIKLGVSVAVAIAVVFGIYLGIAGIRTVDEGYVGIKKVWGNAQDGYLKPGLYIITPWSDEIVTTEVRTQKVEAQAPAGSNDMQAVSTVVAVTFNVAPDSAVRLYREIGQDYQNRVIAPAIQESVKQVTADYKAAELITKREDVKNNINAALKTSLGETGINVEQVYIVDLDFSDGFNAVVDAKVRAEQEALKAENDLKRIETEAKQVAARAEGERLARVAVAQGEAEYRTLTSQAEADAIQRINVALRDSPNYVEYVKAQRWDGKLPTFVGSGDIPFILNMEQLEQKAN